VIRQNIQDQPAIEKRILRNGLDETNYVFTKPFRHSEIDITCEIKPKYSNYLCCTISRRRTGNAITTKNNRIIKTLQIPYRK
jgi:hypothetical protein